MFQTSDQSTYRLARWLLFALVVMVLAKLWMVGGHELLAKFRPHDDSLFATLAINLLEGNWLGEYNNKTLIKGVGYPVFMALSFWSGIPVLTLQHLLYAVACLLVVFALSPLVRYRLSLALLFGFLLFNPLTYSYPLMSATLRSSLYLSLVMMVFAAAIGLWTHRRELGRSAILWSVVLAVSFTWLWNTREESIWILPAIAAFALIYVPPFRWNSGSSAAGRLALLLVPFLVYTVGHFSIISLNKKHYKVPVINELKSDEFTSALGGLMNIRPEKPEQHVTVSLDAQQKAFEASPSFARLKPYLEGESKLVAAFYIWRFRSAVRKVGYYDRPDDATREFEFYRQIGDELKAACEQGTLDCFDRDPTIRPAWHPEFNKEIVPVFAELATQALTFSLFQPDSSGFASKEDMDTLFAYNILTGEDAYRKSEYLTTRLPGYYRDMVARKQGLMGAFGKLYQYLVPVMFALAFGIHLFWLARMAMRRELSPRPVFALVILGSILTILAMLTFVKITIWPVTRPMHTLSPLVLLYIGYVLLPLDGEN